MKQFGIYLHIPFCSSLCHYCDFAKTANFSDKLVTTYMLALASHLKKWLHTLAENGLIESHQVTSVFVGGGTPSLLSHEYEAVFALIKPWLAPDAEVTLEANPDDIGEDRLRTWRSLGFNRISIGVQTFVGQGLEFLKRSHDCEQAMWAVALAARYFERVNIDLIYGWPGQTEALWQQDLQRACSLPVNHLSLYHLTYEPKTPIGRAQNRGLIRSASDDHLADCYELAQTTLARAGFEQYEVSNWSLPGQESRHNVLYWSGASYLGVGTGSAGFFADLGPYGFRYQYDRRERAFKPLGDSPRLELESAEVAETFGVVVEGARSASDWLLEYVGSSLRSRVGFNIELAQEKLGKCFQWTETLRLGLKNQLIVLDSSGLAVDSHRPTFIDQISHGEFTPQNYGGLGILKLRSDQWFLEQAWAQEIIAGFDMDTQRCSLE